MPYYPSPLPLHPSPYTPPPSPVPYVWSSSAESSSYVTREARNGSATADAARGQR